MQDLNGKKPKEIANILAESFFEKAEGITEKEKMFFKAGMAYGVQYSAFILLNHDAIEDLGL